MENINSVFDLEPGSRPVAKCQVCGHTQELPIDIPEYDEYGYDSVEIFSKQYTIICDICGGFDDVVIFISPPLKGNNA